MFARETNNTSTKKLLTFVADCLGTTCELCKEAELGHGCRTLRGQTAAASHQAVRSELALLERENIHKKSQNNQNICG